VTNEELPNENIDINDFDWSPYVVNFADEHTGMGFRPSDVEIKAQRKAQSRRRRKRAGFEWISIIIIALIVSAFARVFVFQTYYIPSASMEPTLLIGDRIIVNKLSVSLGTVNTGDIIVFKAPAEVATQCGDAVADLVKRVVAVPGDVVSSKGNSIIVNGTVLKEKWPHNEPLGAKPIDKQAVPANKYFVIGDNHPDSCDSRYWGYVPKDNIIGKVFVRIWPFSRIHWF
jgi:signal peptidase I